MITNQYAYNGDGQRVQVIDSQGTKKQVWDGENVLVETDGGGSAQVVYTLEPAGYGNLVSQRRGATTSTYLFDALGSTRKLTNSAGSMTDSYDYRAYGETFASSGSTSNVFRWVGEKGYYFDADRSSYYVRARHYSPKQVRWISQDPIGFEGSEWNLYEYTYGNPVNFSDPTGKHLCTPPEECPFRHRENRLWYGCFCGPGLTGTGPVRDSMDNCCKSHDECYGAHRCANTPVFGDDERDAVCHECDRQLCRCLKLANCNQYPVGTNEFHFCEAYRRNALLVFRCPQRGVPLPRPPIPIPRE